MRAIRQIMGNQVGSLLQAIVKRWGYIENSQIDRIGMIEIDIIPYYAHWPESQKGWREPDPLYMAELDRILSPSFASSTD